MMHHGNMIVFICRCWWLLLSQSTPPRPNCTPTPRRFPPATQWSYPYAMFHHARVLSSATEAELGALFYNAKDAAWLCTTLANLAGHPQPPTPIQTDNACATGILNDTVKQRRSKAIDMHFYWLRDRVRQGQFLVQWRHSAENLADYFTKHHSPAHHRVMRSHNLAKPQCLPPALTPPTVSRISANSSILPILGKGVLRNPREYPGFSRQATQNVITPAKPPQLLTFADLAGNCAEPLINLLVHRFPQQLFSV